VPSALFLDRLPSPIGTLQLVCDDADTLCALHFGEDDARLPRLLRRLYGARDVPRPRAAPHAIRDALDAFFAGDLGATDRVAIRTPGSEFQRRVWTALRRIPPGTTTSYGALAAAIGRPGANRAVGLANGANPIGIVVPCHRVIGADGSLTGYGGGMERKRWLLEHERRWAAAAANAPRTLPHLR